MGRFITEVITPALKNISGWIIGVGVMTLFLLILNYSYWVFDPDDTITAKYFVTILAILLYVTIILVLMVLEIGYRYLNNQLPEIEFVKEVKGGTHEGLAKIWIGPSKRFSQGIPVSVYFMDEGQFEILIGVGVVENIQEDERVQILVQKKVEGQSDKFDDLINDWRNVREKFIVKPEVSERYISLLFEGE